MLRKALLRTLGMADGGLKWPRANPSMQIALKPK